MAKFKLFENMTGKNAAAPSTGRGRTLYLAVVFVLYLIFQAEIYLNGQGWLPKSVIDDSLLDHFDIVRLTDHVSKSGSMPSKEDPDVMENVNPDTSRRSWPTEKKNFKRRILVVGCSQTFGMGVKDEETMVWKLNEHYPDVRFDNFGVKGYGTYQSLLMMNYWLDQRKYDGVLYYFMNDHGRRSGKYNLIVVPHGGMRRSPYATIDIFGRLHMYPYYKLDTPLSLSSSAYSFYQYYSTLFEYALEQRVPDRIKMRAYERLSKALIEEMDKSAKKHGCRFAVLNMDPGQNLSGGIRPDCDFAEIGNPNMKDAKYRVRGLLANHPNGLVHAYWAERTIAWIKEHGWLDFSRPSKPSRPQADPQYYNRNYEGNNAYTNKVEAAARP